MTDLHETANIINNRRRDTEQADATLEYAGNALTVARTERRAHDSQGDTAVRAAEQVWTMADKACTQTRAAYDACRDENRDAAYLADLEHDVLKLEKLTTTLVDVVKNHTGRIYTLEERVKALEAHSEDLLNAIDPGVCA